MPPLASELETDTFAIDACAVWAKEIFHDSPCVAGARTIGEPAVPFSESVAPSAMRNTSFAPVPKRILFPGTEQETLQYVPLPDIVASAEPQNSSVPA